MMNLQGSWVAMPTPFTEDNQVDIEGFKLLIARQIKYGTNQLFILGSAGEVTLLSIEEKKLIVKSVIAYMKDRAARGLKVVPVFFSAASFTTEASVEFAQFCEAEGADGVVFTVPPYVLITQHAAKTHLDTCMSSVSIPCGIYNNPSRLGVQVLPETIKYLSEKHPNFVVDKEAMPSVEQLVQVQRLCELLHVHHIGHIFKGFSLHKCSFLSSKKQPRYFVTAVHLVCSSRNVLYSS